MTFSDQQTQMIEKLASIFLPISDIASILGVDPDELKRDIRYGDSEAAAAYRRGKANSRAAIHAQEMKLARLGSPLGIEQVSRHLTAMELDE